ncbi:hypothetical protein LB505_008798 [Fusarium chuoi]|nr:hypothetical protein LB505_008798 [Fusarium chuoi]
MNSLNILTARVSPPPSPTQSRSNSIGGGPIGTIGLASDDQHGDGRPSGHDTESFAQDTIDESRFTEKPADETKNEAHGGTLSLDALLLALLVLLDGFLRHWHPQVSI